MAEKIAVYPGTFDPITLGHLGVIKESSKIFDKVVIGLLINPAKNPRFTEEERKTMIEESVADIGLNNVEVKTFNGLAVQLARQEKAMAIIRGLRMTTEYEAELNLALNNRAISPDITTILVPPRQEHLHISSTVVRELLSFGHTDIDEYVPQAVLECVGIMEERYKARLFEVCRRLAGHKALAMFVGNAIVKHYQEPHRAYHTLKHINNSLGELQGVWSHLLHPDEVEMEILCHDAVFKIGAKDNEEKSAEFAKEMVKLLGRSDCFGEIVAELVIATKHDITPTYFDAQVAVDIDLAFLGYPEREFKKNTEKIRREYVESGRVTNEEFNNGRIIFFKRFLPPNRATIYLTKFFRDKYEAQAQANIARSIT